MSILALTKDNFEKIVEKNPLVLVDFWANWCGPCKSFAPTYENVSNLYPDIIFGSVDIEAEPELAEDFNVRSIPTLMVFKNKIVVFAESGVIPRSALCELIERAKNLNMSEIYKKIAEQEGKQGD